MRALLERHCEHCGTVRIWESDAPRYGEPYVWACGVKFHYEDDPDIIYLGGYTTKLTGRGLAALWELFKQEGYRYAVWEAPSQDGGFIKDKWRIEDRKRTSRERVPAIAPAWFTY